MKYGLFLIKTNQRYNKTLEFRNKDEATKAAVAVSVALNEWVEAKEIAKWSA